MHIYNWQHQNELWDIIQTIRSDGDEENVINIARDITPAWYHFSLLSRTLTTQKIHIISRDKRVIDLAKQYGFSGYSTLEKIHTVVPDGLDIIQHNLGPLDYLRFHMVRLFQRFFRTSKHATSQVNMDIFSVQHSSWYILILGIVLVLLLITSIISLTSPHAIIDITPQTTVTNAIRNVTFVVDDAITEDTEVPLRKELFSYATSKTYTITTYDPLSLKKAQGQVTITNGSNEPINLKPQTRLVTDDIVFRTTKWVTIPAAIDSTPGRAVVNVTADTMSNSGLIGKKGNIPAGTVLTFPGLEGGDIELYAEAASDFTGGDDTYEPLLTAEERVRLEKLFREYFLGEARSSIMNEYSNKKDYIPLPISEAVTEFSTKITADQEAGSREARVVFQGTGDFLVYLYDADQVRKNLIQLASEHLLKGVESFVDTGAMPSIVQVLSVQEDPIKIKATVQIPLSVLYDFESAAGQKTLQNTLSDLLGAEKDRAQKSLLNHPYIQSVEIHVTPFWSRKLPFSLKNIDIQVER